MVFWCASILIQEFGEHAALLLQLRRQVTRLSKGQGFLMELDQFLRAFPSPKASFLHHGHSMGCPMAYPCSIKLKTYSWTMYTMYCNCKCTSPCQCNAMKCIACVTSISQICYTLRKSTVSHGFLQHFQLVPVVLHPTSAAFARALRRSAGVLHPPGRSEAASPVDDAWALSGANHAGEVWL